MRAGRTLIAISLVISSLGACGDGDTMKVIIDSDGAFDDMKAILYLLQQPDVEIGAITFSGTGIAHCPAAAENASALLERIDGPDIPIACGRSTPIEGSNSRPTRSEVSHFQDRGRSRAKMRPRCCGTLSTPPERMPSSSRWAHSPISRKHSSPIAPLSTGSE